MRTFIVVLTTCTVTACAASAHSRASEEAPAAAREVGPVHAAPAAVDLTGLWTTGSTGEPEVKQIVLRPQCNYSPGHWIIEQAGDSLRAWNIPDSWTQGIATREGAVSKVGVPGRVSGMDVVIGTSDPHYVLHYDSTSGHLRGALDGAPFWAVRLEIVRPEGCIPPP